MYRTRNFLFAASVWAALLAAAPAAAEQKLITQSGSWRAIEATQGRKHLCFVISTPKERLPAGLRRDPGSLFVTLKPKGQRVASEMSVQFGFRLAKDGHAVVVDDHSFALTPGGETAWLRAEADEDDIVRAMRAGRTLTVTARSARGNATTDVYDLIGFTAAFEELQKRCRR